MLSVYRKYPTNKDNIIANLQSIPEQDLSPYTAEETCSEII
jgi:hypothetical protein